MKDAKIRFRDQYDWIVLGNSVGGLLSANLAVKLGLSVLILPHERSAQRFISDRGQCFDPEPNSLLGLRTLVRAGGLLGECLGKVGFPGDDSLVRKQEALPQVITPRSRVQFCLSDGDFELEWQREFGPAITDRAGLPEALKAFESDFLQYWLQLPQRLTLEAGGKAAATKGGSGGVGSLLARLRKEARTRAPRREDWLSEKQDIATLAEQLGRRDLASLVEGFWYALTGNPRREPCSLAETLQLFSVGRSSGAFRGGQAAFREHLIRHAKLGGAHVPERGECRRVFLKSGRFVGIQISSHGNMIAGNGAAIACALDHMAPRVDNGGGSWARKLKASPTPDGWRFTVALTVHGEAIPPGMTSRTVWQEASAPPLEIEVADPADYGFKDAELRLVFLRTVLPWTPESLERGYQRLIATRMLRQLTQVVPFIEYHITRLYPDFRTYQSSPFLTAAAAQAETVHDELEQVYDFTELGQIPGNLRCYGGKGVGSRSGIEGLFVLSEESFPELGTLGGTVAALESIAWLAHRTGLAGPLS